MSDAAAHIAIRNLTKRFGGVVAVRDVTLDVPRGSFTTLLGPSGCGKTTILRTLAGFYDADAGDLFIGGRRVNDVPSHKRNAAMVFQDYALFPHMTVFENVGYGLGLAGVRGEARRRKVESVLRDLGLEGLGERMPGQISGGQQQRVALARVLVMEPEALLLDEPLSNLDAKLRIQTRAELIKLHRRLGITTVYVTHDQVEAMTMGDRIVVMRDGLVQQVDTPLQIYRYPANRFVAGFIGSPPMNFVTASVEGNGSAIYVKANGFRVKVDEPRAPKLQDYVGKQVIFGIRPSDIYDQALPGAVPPTADNTVTVEVEVIEPMGAECVLYVNCGGDDMVVNLDSATGAKERQPLEVVFDMAKCHVFDQETEVTII